MTIERNYSLKQLNTFGFDIKADYFATPATVEELCRILADERYRALPRLIMGSGSNLLFCSDFKGLVIQPKILGIEKTAEDTEFVYLRAGAGVVWDNLVAHAVANGWGGIENLSLIPGHVGASPVQNIGAYGAEAKDSIHRVECVLTDTCELKIFTNEECSFGYRDSVFKNEWRGKAVVTHVTYRLRKTPQLDTHYGNVEDELRNFPEISLNTVRQAIVAIRSRKLPDTAELGNAGSFFKNPVVPKTLADAIVAQDPKMTVYPVNDTQVKLPAGRLIELAGWKGKRVGSVGVHTQQALVLVSYGGGTGRDIFQLAQAIQQSIREKFDIELEMEVNAIGCV